MTGTYHDSYPAYVTHAFGDDGQLGPAYVRDFGELDYGRVTVDVESNVLYKEGATGLTAHLVTPDGSLRQAGASDLCVGTKVWGATPIVAVRGFVFAGTSIDEAGTTCCLGRPSPRAAREPGLVRGACRRGRPSRRRSIVPAAHSPRGARGDGDGLLRRAREQRPDPVPDPALLDARRREPRAPGHGRAGVRVAGALPPRRAGSSTRTRQRPTAPSHDTWSSTRSTRKDTSRLSSPLRTAAARWR